MEPSPNVPPAVKKPNLLGRAIILVTKAIVFVFRFVFASSQRITVDRLALSHSRGPLGKIRLIHLSDIHYDEEPFPPRILDSQLDEMVQVVNALNPDAIVITGAEKLSSSFNS